MLRKGMREEDHIRWRREQDRTIRLEAVANCQRYRGAAERMTHQAICRAERIRYYPERARELRQRSLVALGRTMRGRIEQHNLETVFRQRLRKAAEPAGPAAPSVSENYDRAAAPDPHRQILVFALDDLRSPRRKKRLLSRP